MHNSIALYDYLIESPRMSREETFVRIPRTKPRRDRSTGSGAKQGGIHQRKNKRCTW
jgi:hypothetical protein